MIVTEHECYQKEVEVYRGLDAAEQFVLLMHEEYEALEPLLYSNEEMTPLTEEEKLSYANATVCYLCTKPLTPNDKVHDHDHYSGQYLGATHGVCNRERQTDKHLPILFHNFKVGKIFAS